jgi:hypothetical protein
MHPDHFRRLARRAWREHNGPIPKGYHIHHMDLDETNFAIDNLRCLSASEHRLWHKTNGPHHPKPCAQCGKQFIDGFENNGKFCSNACRSAFRRASGIDDEARLCASCGKAFRVNKYAQQRYCSLECTAPGTYERSVAIYTCKGCGKPFEAKDRRAIWCSNSCRKRSYRAPF